MAHKDLVVERPDVEATETNGSAPKAAPRSALARIRKRRTAFNRERHVDLDIPGYGGDLVARYQPLTYDETLELNEAVAKMQGRKEPRAVLYGQIDTLARACEGIYLRDGKVLTPIDPDDPAPVIYDSRLAALLDFDIDDSNDRLGPARQAILGTFPDELAVVAHHADYVEWLNHASEEVDDDLLGE